VRQSGEGDRWRWYKFNASDEVLSEDDGTKCCQKMKRRQQAHLDSIGRKCDTAWGVVTSVGGEVALGRGKRGDDISWTDANLTWLKNKKIMWSIQLLQIDGEHLEQCQLGWRESYLTKK
jgi:hypothetical protein